MNLQMAFNIVFMIAAFLGGFIFKAVWEKLEKLSEKIGDFPKDYVPRAELIRVLDTIDKKLDRIENKLDTKADKHGQSVIV